MDTILTLILLYGAVYLGQQVSKGTNNSTRLHPDSSSYAKEQYNKEIRKELSKYMK